MKRPRGVSSKAYKERNKRNALNLIETERRENNGN